MRALSQKSKSPSRFPTILSEVVFLRCRGIEKRYNGNKPLNFPKGASKFFLSFSWVTCPLIDGLGTKNMVNFKKIVAGPAEREEGITDPKTLLYLPRAHV